MSEKRKVGETFNHRRKKSGKRKVGVKAGKPMNPAFQQRKDRIGNSCRDLGMYSSWESAVLSITPSIYTQRHVLSVLNRM